ncbi:uncharacterized membrane protein YbhN (UPF0104 family) [Alteromonadaceae bacterium 2753L.S.0a.02]|nr:uncharacterized membrane protein YbhN (UPF0104 family) [Alteromonadaceae bacterium 2753L.S.0a.02]
MPKYFYTLLKAAFALAMLLALIVWVETQYGWASTLANWSKISVWQVVLLAIGVFSSHLLRVSRVFAAYTFKQPVSFKSVSAVSFLHNTISFLLPMRLGELALPALGKHQLAIDYRYSAAVLLLLRLFDAHVLLCLLVFFAGTAWLKYYAWIAPLVLLAGLPLGVHVLKIMSAQITKLAFATPLVSDTRRWLTLYGYTVAIWVVKLFSLAMLASVLGGIPLNHAWLATILADGSALSPVTGFANAGTFELAFALPLKPLGYAMESMVQIAVNVHIFIFVTNIAVGIVGFLLLQNKHTQTSPESHA